MAISREDFDAWRSNPVTKAVFAQIDREIAERAHGILQQRVVPSQLELENIRGRAQAFADLKNMEIITDE